MKVFFVLLTLASFCQLAAAASSESPAFQVPVKEAKVILRGNTPVVTINGAATFWACHCLRDYHVTMGEKWPEGIRQAVKQFAARGIHRFEAQVDLGWKTENKFDPAGTGVSMPVDAVMEAILQADPRAQVVLRVGAHNLLPNLLPEWLTTRLGDELEMDSTGKKYSVSFASEEGFRVITLALSNLVRHVESQSYAGNIVGYNVFLEFEGVPWGSVSEGAFTDYSPAMLRTWRSFLAQRYPTDTALKEAWGDPQAVVAQASLPTPQDHLGGDSRMIFHDPIKGRKARDYYELMDELTLRRHHQVAKAVKEACGYRKLVGMMGGYSPDAGEPRSIASPTGFPDLQLHKQHFSGPGCWERAFDIPEIDFYFAPRDYLNTGMGGVCLPLNATASLRLHGKVAWVEDDQRTYLHKGIFDPQLKDARESVMAHRRNAALLYTECGAGDWMEQISNWLMDPTILDNLGQLNQLLEQSSTVPDVTPDAICVLFDEDSQGWTKPTTLLDEELFYLQRNGGWSYCGVPVRFHLLSDLAKSNFPRYKFYILPNVYHWTPEKERLLSKIKRDGNVLLWQYGAGYVGDHELSVQSMEQTTGIRIGVDNVPWEHRISITNFTHPITRNLPADLTFGTSRHYGPIFHVDDPDAEILGRSFGFQMKRAAALVIKSFGKGARGGNGKALGSGDYAAIYCEAPNLPAELLRGMAQYAGCHVYLESNDFLIAGKDLIMVHSAKPGKRTLRLPYSSTVTEWPSQKMIAENVKSFAFRLDMPGTMIFQIKPLRH